MLIDLQLHSTYSDGYLSPTELVDFLLNKKIKIASLTDHNTVAGLEEFSLACEKKQIKSIKGLELYVKYKNKKMNIILYNFDDSAPELHEVLRETQIRRRRGMREILKKLNKKGFDINLKILDKFTHYVPVNKVIDEILKNPFNAKKIKTELRVDEILEGDVIGEYFRNKKIGVLHESYVKIERIFKLRKKIGGQIILNHPAKNSWINPKIWQELKKMGMDGIELLSPHHSLGAVMYIQHLARNLDLIETGGSDFHRFEGGGYPIQSSYDYMKIDSKYLRGINKIIL
jgi:3',5'-nucleoside bisphosphate phosphatase